LLPNPHGTSITLVTSPTLASYDLSLLDLFDPRLGELRPRAKFIDKAPGEESIIKRLVRTPEGRGIGVIRSEGGEIWKAPKKRVADLVRSGRWLSADLVAVLDGGMTSTLFIDVILSH
jgi:hypothetical protein